MDLENGEVIAFVPENGVDEWFVLGDGNGEQIGEHTFDTYGAALKERQRILSSSCENYSTVEVLRVSDAFC